MTVALDLLQEAGVVSPFPGSQFPYPLNQSLFGEMNLESLRRSGRDIDGSHLNEELPVLLALAEAVEASLPDKSEFFVADRELRARLVRLNSTDGWALLWGADDQPTAELAARLQREHFQVYTVLAGDNDTSLSLRMNKQFRFFGSRQTSSIYFLQLLVRYAHIYGRIPLGDTHEVGEFIQD